jgi:hypothetical protein
MMLGSVLFWTSCEDDPDDPSTLKPTINFKGGAGYVSADVTLNITDPFTIGINAISNATSNANLTLLEITRTFDNAVWFSWDTAINVSYYSLDINFQAGNIAGTEKIAFKITDKDGQTNEITVNVTTENPAGPISSFDQRILGSYESTIGSSFASIDGTVYTLQNAKNNQSKIDWLYFYGVSLLATIAAPDDGGAASVYNNATYGLQTWSTKNKTRFRKVTSAINWESITDDTIILQETASGVDQTRITELTAGNVLAFTAASGKKGMIKVNNIVAGADGSIDISVKVQQ